MMHDAWCIMHDPWLIMGPLLQKWIKLIGLGRLDKDWSAWHTHRSWHYEDRGLPGSCRKNNEISPTWALESQGNPRLSLACVWHGGVHHAWLFLVNLLLRATQKGTFVKTIQLSGSVKISLTGANLAMINYREIYCSNYFHQVWILHNCLVFKSSSQRWWHHRMRPA